MLFSLLALSLRGSLIAALVWLADRLCARKMTAGWRRVWWLLVPLAFLLPVDLTSHSAPAVASPDQQPAVTAPANPLASVTAWSFQMEAKIVPATVPWLLYLWISGAAVSAAWIIIPTLRVQRQWSRQRLSTDPELLDLLEDCKSTAGVTAPFGLIVSDKIETPALLGWLRPRLLLPSPFASSSSRDELRAVLLHELAHFKHGDVPFNWLFALARVLHWFNPVVYLTGAAWARFREEAADENAIRWLAQSDGDSYGQILLKLLGHCRGGNVPSGALAIGESVTNLKRRILMIRHYPAKSRHALLASMFTLALAAFALIVPIAPIRAAADDTETTAKTDAVAAMQPWLAEIEAGQYAKSWTDASASFRKAVTSDQWVAAAKAVVVPLGKLKDRKLSSSLYQTDVPMPNGATLKGQFVIAQFDSSYDNLSAARETVCFEKEADGVWRASGYYIKPR